MRVNRYRLLGESSTGKTLEHITRARHWGFRGAMVTFRGADVVSE